MFDSELEAPTFAITIIEPARTFVTEMSELQLALNMHTLIACLKKLGEAILVVPSMLDSEILMALGHIVE